MDILTTIEPQLAIPVVGVVLCALLVYIFGFQKTQEPSFQHLALLQSTSKGSRASNANLRQRSSTPQVKASSKTKATVANGHAVQEKASPKPNGTAKSPKVTRDPSNKENVRPQQQQQKLTPKKVKISKDAADDLESGDWIQASSRKDRKSQDKKSKKENIIVTTIKLTKEAITEEEGEKPVTVLRDVTPTKIQCSPVKQTEEETPVKEEAAPAPLPVPTTPKKAKETKKKAEKATVPAVDTSPKKTENNVENKVVAPVKVAEKVTLISTTTSSPEVDSEISKENSAPAAAAPPVKAPIPTKVVEESNSSDPRNNIAFDEMGDAWEEAKSARAKKRRARKD